MTRRLRDRARPWLGSALLHVAFVAVLVVAAWNWRSDPPPQQLAIEGDVVRYEDLPPSVRAGKPLSEPPATPPEPTPEPKAIPPEPTPPPTPEPTAEEQRQAAEALRLEQERLAAERKAEQQRAAELEQAREAELRRKQEAEALAAKQRAAEEAEARRKAEQEALAAKARQAEQERAAREAKARAEREAALQRALESEEEGEAFARSGIVDEYRALLTQTIERNWIRPPSARAGLQCTLHVTQVPGGTVTDVRIAECNGDQAVRESITTAVYKSSPLPAPRDPRAFQRQLVMVFKPTE
jgi:colicin import membrane protein